MEGEEVMPDQPGTLENLLLTFARILSPLKQRLENSGGGDLFAELGLGFPAGLESVPGFSSALQNTIAQLDEMAQQTDELAAALSGDSATAVLSAGVELTAQTVNVVQSIDEMAEALASAGSATGLPAADVIAFADTLSKRLIDYLIVSYLAEYPALVELLQFIGAVEAAALNADSTDPAQPPYTAYELRFDQLLSFIQSPSQHLSALYQWGDSDFDGAALLDALTRLLAGAGIPAIFDQTVSPPVLDMFAVEIRPKLTINPEGLSITFPDGVDLIPEPVLDDDFTLEVSLDVPIEQGLEILIQPDDQITAIPPQGELGGKLAVEWVGEYGDGTPLIIFGQIDGSRLEAQQLRLAASVNFSWNNTARQAEGLLELEGEIKGGLLVITLGEADSFIREITAGLSLEQSFDLAFGFSSQKGLYFAGSGALEIQLPFQIDLGVLVIDSLSLSFRFEDGEIILELGADFSVTLGVFDVTVHQIGLATSFALPEDRHGNLGMIDFGLGFKPPTGVSFAFDFVGLVYGSGTINFDPEKSEYSGIISAQIVSIGITAIAIITTQLPDNPEGWSLFISINVDLGGIPLGFGFTLEKVGGLIGVHRSIDTAALQSGIRTGMLDSILFPDDPLADATRILSDIETAFPTAQGSFVVGAMLQIGWGTPTIITADLGLIIQVPDLIIALIGQAEAILPFDDFALIEVHFDVLGILDMAAGTLAIDAGLRDSRMVGYVLTGQMALRASFLTEPSFLLSLGGFHPAFVPPESFPKLDRLGLGLSLGSWLNISLEAYLALTSNTLQFGAGLYLTASLSGFSIEGGTEINTLIQFSPFQFRADLRYYITVSAASIELLGVLLTGELSGPNPYYVRGVAHFKLFGLQKDVDIEETIGDKSPLDDIDDVPVLPDVVAALEDPESWRAVDDGARIGAVLLAQIEDATAPIAVHPGGSVEVVQRVAPLAVELEHYGNAEIDGEDTLDVTDVEAGGDSIAWEFVEDWFAPAQFFDLTEDEKLSAPSFEKMKGGLRLGDDEAESGPRADTIYDYKQIIRDPEFEVPSLALNKSFRPQLLSLSDLQAQVVTGFGTQRPLIGQTAAQLYQLNPARYAPVERETLTIAGGISTQEMTHAEASQMLRQDGIADQIVVTSSERQIP